MGLALRLDPNSLNGIEAKKSDVENNLSDVLEEWLKKSYDTESFGDPSWKLLVDAVAHPVGGKDRALAMEIAAKYNGRFNWSYTLSFAHKYKDFYVASPYPLLTSTKTFMELFLSSTAPALK